MKTNIKTVIAVIVIATFVAGTAFAGPSCGFPGQGDKHSRAKDSIVRELNLSTDQQNRLDQERTAHREAMETLRSALKEKKDVLRDAMNKPDVTREQVEPLLTEIKKLQSDMADKRVDGIFAVKEILSPEQFAKLQSKKEKGMKAGHKKRAGNRQRKDSTED
ncbi:MAG: Spy/CpxP family protein refolding chaperone [Candidatus Omnitrophota bacterium]